MKLGRNEIIEWLEKPTLSPTSRTVEEHDLEQRLKTLLFEGADSDTLVLYLQNRMILNELRKIRELLER